MFQAQSHPFAKLLDAHQASCTTTAARAALLVCCTLLNSQDLVLVTNGSTGQIASGTFQSELSTVQMRHKATNTLLDVSVLRSGPDHVTVVLSPSNGATGSEVTPTAQVLSTSNVKEDIDPKAVIEAWTPKLLAQLRGGAGASISIGTRAEPTQEQECRIEETSTSHQKERTSTSCGFSDVKPVSFEDFQRNQATREALRYGESDLAPGGGASVGPGFGRGGRGVYADGGSYVGPQSNLFQSGGQVGTEFGRGDGPCSFDPFSATPNADHEPLSGVPRGPGGRPLGGHGGGRGGLGGGFANRPGSYFM